MVKIHKTITVLLIIGFICGFIKVFFEQNILLSQVKTPNFSTGDIFKYISAISVITSGFLALIYEGKYFKKYIKIIYFIILLWITAIYFRDGKGIDPSNFFSVKAPGPWLAFSVIFTTSNNERVNKINNVLYFGLIALSIGLLINIGKLGVSFDRHQAWLYLRAISNNHLWVLPVTLFFNINNKKRRLIIVTCLIIGMFASILIVTRSTISLYAIILFIYLIKSKIISKPLNVIALILIFILFIISLNSLIESETGQKIIQGMALLEDRIQDDTRTDQIIQFTNQLKLSDLLLGAGTDSYWNWDGRDYEWLDNQWLLTAWWAGILPTFLFLLLMLIPLRFAITSKNIKHFANGFMLLLWILGCAGLSIYISFSINIYFYIAAFSTGYCLFNYNLFNKSKRVKLYDIKVN
ncbi:MAG: hypothetical protein JXB17_11905 [Bacteroidales bacterium]|nr:hypothetical protein [Bacteroidales bacterium]